MRLSITLASALLTAALGARIVQLRRRERQIELAGMWPETLED